jgi:hypothetical protein
VAHFRISFVSAPEAVPLWREVVVGDTEPWRRGRLFLVVYAIISLANHAFVLADFVLRGLLDPLVFNAAVSAIFWLQFYFIWIGVSWVRWIQAAFGGLISFALIIWGLRDGMMFWVGLGVFNFALSAYLGLAPSVYFFAKHQRERRRWIEVIAVGFVFLLLLASLGAGMLGIAGYRASRMAAALEFGNRAFEHIFAEHDTQFLLERTTDRLMKEGGGVGGLTKFLQVTTMRAGDVHDIKPSIGTLRCWYKFPFGLGTYGEVISEGIGDRGRVRLWMRIGEGDQGWQIDAVWWTYIEGAKG